MPSHNLRQSSLVRRKKKYIIIAVLLLIEAVLRYERIPYRITWLPEYPAYDTIILYKIILMTRKSYEYRPGLFIEGIGSCLGMRCNGHPPADCAGKKPIRVLCLGGSTTMGDGVNDSETYPAQLEMILNSEGSGPPCRFMVINSGMPGTTSFYGVHKSMLDELKTEPRCVVIGYGGLNDCMRLHFKDGKFHYLSIPFRIARSFHLYRLFEHSTYRYFLQPQVVERVSVEEYMANLRVMHDFFSAKNIPVVFLSEMMRRESKHPSDIFYSFSNYPKAMMATAAALKAPFVDAETCLGLKEGVLLADGVHWTAAGNRGIAECLSEVINGIAL